MLNEVEQLAIEAMVGKGLKVSTIKKKLGKHGKEVDNYISEVEKGTSEVNHVVKSGVLARLAKAGITGTHAEDLMSRTVRRMDSVENTSVEELYNACISMIGARELIKTTSDTGNSGVAVMTGEAAVHGKDLHEQVTMSRKARPVIFRPKTGKMANEE